MTHEAEHLEATAPPGALVAALAAAELEFETVTPDKTNTHFGNRYASLGAIIAATRPALARHGLVLTQRLAPHVGNADFIATKLVTTLHHVSGEVLTSEIVLPPWKGPQDAGSLLTYLRRYTVAGLLNLASEDDDDGEDAQRAQQTQQRDTRGRSGTQTRQNTRGPQNATQREPAARQQGNGRVKQQAEEWHAIAEQLADAIDNAPNVARLDGLIPSLNQLPAELRPPLRVRFSERRKALEEIARDLDDLDEAERRWDEAKENQP